MVNCIVLDGFHKGELVRLPHAYPTIKLARPMTVTICECSPDAIHESRRGKGEKTYRRSFLADDGKTALYSETGDSDIVIRNVGTIVQRREPLAVGTLYLDCRDDRAFL